MKVIVDIKDSKVNFVMELLNCLSYVKEVKPVLIKKSASAKKKEFLGELKEAVEEVRLAKAGKIKLKSAKQFLDEL